MFDSQKRVIWEYNLPGGWLIDFDVVEATGLVYGTAGDNIMFILDLSSGKELEKSGRNGSAAYGDVKAYGKDLCLIRDDFRVYREKVPDPSFEPMKDRLAAWRGTQLLWQLDFPPDAELIVREKKIFALTKTKTRVYLKGSICSQNVVVSPPKIPLVSAHESKPALRYKFVKSVLLWCAGFA